MQTKAQSMVEYSVLFCIILAALLVMSVYMKRAMQGRLRGSAEDLSQGGFYSPGVTTSTTTTTSFIQEQANTEHILNLTSNETLPETITKSVTNITTVVDRDEEVGGFQDEPKR